MLIARKREHSAHHVLIIRIHGNGKNLLKVASLEGCREVMEEVVIHIILFKDAEETTIHSINKSIANALGNLLIARKRAHSTHHALIIRIHGNANMVTIPIDKILPDMVEADLGLVCVASAFFCENIGTNMMPCKLEDFSTSLQIDLIGVCICSLQIKNLTLVAAWGYPAAQRREC